MNRGWVESKDIRKADSDEENMREAGWVEVIVIEEYEALKIERDELAERVKKLGKKPI